MGTRQMLPGESAMVHARRPRCRRSTGPLVRAAARYPVRRRWIRRRASAVISSTRRGQPFDRFVPGDSAPSRRHRGAFASLLPQRISAVYRDRRGYARAESPLPHMLTFTARVFRIALHVRRECHPCQLRTALRISRGIRSSSSSRSLPPSGRGMIDAIPSPFSRLNDRLRSPFLLRAVYDAVLTHAASTCPSPPWRCMRR